MSHGHQHGPAPTLATPRTPRRLLLGALGIVAVLAVVAVALLWPDHSRLQQIQDRSQYSGPGVSYPSARVDAVAAPCPTSGTAPTACGTLDATVTEGPSSGQQVTVSIPAEVTASSLAAGDSVQLTRTDRGSDVSFSYSTVERRGQLLWLTLAFVLVVVAVARLRGLLAIVSLAFAAVAIWEFTLPALLTGEQGTLVALASGVAIMVVVLYLTHGPSLRTSVALAGTVAGLLVTAGLGLLLIDGAHLTGVADETGGYLTAGAGSLNFAALLSAGIIVAGLGVLNDVTVTQASAVWELRAASPTMTRRQVFASAMRIGRDHVASTIYTLAFAYAGAALVTLLLLQLYDRPLLDLLSTEELAEEVVRTLTSGIGLALAVPLTTAIGAWVAGPGATTADTGPDAPTGRRRAARRASYPWEFWR